VGGNRIQVYHVYLVLPLVFKDKGRAIGIPTDFSFLLYDIAEAGSIIWTWFL